MLFSKKTFFSNKKNWSICERALLGVYVYKIQADILKNGQLMVIRRSKMAIFYPVPWWDFRFFAIFKFSPIWAF